MRHDTATLGERREWFAEGVLRGATHLIVVCDTFSYEDYMVFVMPDEDVYKVVAKYQGMNMQRVDEIFHLGSDREAQMIPGKRAMNYERLEQPPAEKFCEICTMVSSASIHTSMDHRLWHRFSEGPPPSSPPRLNKNGLPSAKWIEKRLPGRKLSKGHLTLLSGGKKDEP